MHSSRMPSSATQELTMSVAELSNLSRKRLRPGKVRANTNRHTTKSAVWIGSRKAIKVSRNTVTVSVGSRNAATNDVTDCGAL